MQATLKNFSGGINTFVDAQLLSPEHAVDVLDAEVSNGSIAPRPTAKKALPPTSKLVVNNPNGLRSVVKFGENTFWSDNDTEQLNSTLGYMGVPAPAAALSLADGYRGELLEGNYKYSTAFVTKDGVHSATHTGGAMGYTQFNAKRTATIVQTRDAEPFNPLHKIYVAKGQETDLAAAINLSDHYWNKYDWHLYGYRPGTVIQHLNRYYKSKQAVVNYVSRSNNDHTRNPFSDNFRPLGGGTTPPSSQYWEDVTTEETLVTGLNSIEISNIPVSTESFVAKVLILRTIDRGSSFYIAGVVTNGQRTFSDSLSDSDLMQQLPFDMMGHVAPITYIADGSSSVRGGKYLTELNELFFLAAGTRVYVSAQSDPHSWDPFRYLQFDEDVTAIAAGNASIIAFTKNKRYLITGTTFADLSRLELPTRQGCPNWRTIASLGNNLVWQSNDGIATFGKQPEIEGDRTTLVTANKYVFDAIANFAVVANDVYYLFFDDHVVAVDFKHELKITRLSLSGYQWAWWDENEDRLYLLASTGEWRAFSGTPETWTYLTPRLQITEDRSQKKLRRVYLNCDDDVDMTIYTDGVEAWRKTLTNRQRRRDLTSYVKSGIIGSDIQFRFRSKGVLHSVTIDFRQAGAGA